MSLYLSNLVVWMLGVGGHISQRSDFGAGRSRSSAAANRTLLRVLAVSFLAAALLLLALWAAVWLTIQLL
jgi:hypothetical protein